ncbi:MAG: DUF1467 family protein [Alphaproteobacteria bacterium]|nr:DUF1467 family protein [Alphaproteobacteria bacterium]
MDVVSAIVVFVIAWWLVFFMVLPIGVKSPEETGEGRIQGTEAGAPVNPRLARKIVITTAVAVVLWLIYFGIVESGLITLRPQGG